MMTKPHNFSAIYLPIGVPTFHLESAQEQFEDSLSLLCELDSQVCGPEKMLLSLDALKAFLEGKQPDLVILQNVTFANAAYATEVLRRVEAPILLWTLREPVIDGGRLRLNSLTGAYSAANALHAFDRGSFEYLLGSPKEEDTRRGLDTCLRAARLKKQLQGLKIAAVGHTPQGFGFGRALDSELAHVFGVELETVEARELMDLAKSFTAEECEPFLQLTRDATAGFDKIPDQNQLDHARLYKAYANYAAENKIGAIASRCWPDFFTAFGTPVCGVLSMLNNQKLPASCEADIYGVLSMYIGTALTCSPTFFGDPVSLDEEAGTITYWHCGMAAPTLANACGGACVGVHPNRKIGPAMDFACKGNERVTILRVGRKPDGSFRIFVARGEALNRSKQFTGTSVVVKTDFAARELVYSSVQAGWEPHFVVAYGDIAKELGILSRMLGLELWSY